MQFSLMKSGVQYVPAGSIVAAGCFFSVSMTSRTVRYTLRSPEAMQAVTSAEAVMTVPALPAPPAPTAPPTPLPITQCAASSTVVGVMHHVTRSFCMGAAVC